MNLFHPVSYISKVIKQKKQIKTDLLFLFYNLLSGSVFVVNGY